VPSLARSLTMLFLFLSFFFVGFVAGDSSIFRYPYSDSTFVRNSSASDGLPDFTLQDAVKNFTSSSIACPAVLQRPCCLESGSDNNCDCNCKDGMRFCKGGLFCANIVHQGWPLYDNKSKWIPNYVGNPLHRPIVNRTRRNILERGIAWLAMHSPYLGCGTPSVSYTLTEGCASDDPPHCPQYSHTASCQGFVQMAYGAKTYDAKGDRVVIDCHDIRPGDAVAHHGKSGGVSHVFLFRNWVKRNALRMRIWQMGGEHGAANVAIQQIMPLCSRTKTQKCYSCFGYKHIVEEG